MNDNPRQSGSDRVALFLFLHNRLASRAIREQAKCLRNERGIGRAQSRFLGVVEDRGESVGVFDFRH